MGAGQLSGVRRERSGGEKKRMSSVEDIKAGVKRGTLVCMRDEPSHEG